MSTVRACRLGGISRAGWYRKSTTRNQTALRMRIREIALDRPRFGFQRIHVVQLDDRIPDLHLLLPRLRDTPAVKVTSLHNPDRNRPVRTVVLEGELMPQDL